MYGLEIAIVCIFIFIAVLILMVTQKIYKPSEMCVSTEDVKPKIKVNKKTSKVKIAKREIGIVKIVSNAEEDVHKSEVTQEAEEEERIPISEKSTKKLRKKRKDDSVNVPPQPVEKNSFDYNEEWKEVSKSPKKTSKIENKGDLNIKTEPMEEAMSLEPEVLVVTDAQISQVHKKKSKKVSKSKVSNIIDSTIVASQLPEAKTENFGTDKHADVKVKQGKEKHMIDESKSKSVYENSDNSDDRIKDLMSELERLKSQKNEENKVAMQTINQLNKEVDSLRQKIRINQSTEEKLNEELKKKNSSYSDIKTQFVIVQSELTKAIVQREALLREKEKSESRYKSLEESHRRHAEKAEKFDEVNSEKDNLYKKLKASEEECMVTKARFSEYSKEKELESKEKIDQLQTDRQRMQEQLVRVQADHIENNTKLQKTQQELLSTKSTCNDLLNENMRLQKNSTSSENLNTLVKDQHYEIGQKNEKLSMLSKELEELKKINEKLVEEREILIKKCQNISPDVRTGEKIESLTTDLNNTKELLSKTENELTSQKDRNENLSSKINELNIEKEELSLLVDKYKTGLENTESILSKLQMSVNEEESKWRDILLKSENEAEKCKNELEKAYNDLSRIRYLKNNKTEINFAYHCVDKSLSSLIDEMEARMNHFEESLEAVIRERDCALSQIQLQMNGNGNSIETHLTNDSSDCEMVKIKEDLSNQVERNRSLEMNCNKYQSLIDATKEALEAEKVQVQVLKEELKILQNKSPANDNQNL